MMMEQFNFGNGVHEIKLGSTFTSDPKSSLSFHTLKYDFKPASVDLSKPATLDVSSNKQVTVTVPHLDSSSVSKTVFKGNQRNYTKECVLIIDKVTGEITLEKVHYNIQVKKTRSETNPRPSTTFPSMPSGGANSSSVNAGPSKNGAVNDGANAASSRKVCPENIKKRVRTKRLLSTGKRTNAIGSPVPPSNMDQFKHNKQPTSSFKMNATSLSSHGGHTNSANSTSSLLQLYEDLRLSSNSSDSDE